MTVSVTLRGVPRASQAGVSAAVVKKRAQGMLRALGLPDAELSVMLTTDAVIHELNAEFRHKDKPTDVLAFAMREGEVTALAPGESEMLGDVVISLETATRQAKEHGQDLLAEVTMLLAHGVLHLVGFDHQTDREEREMQAKTRELLRAVTEGVATAATARKSAGPGPQVQPARAPRRAAASKRAPSRR